MLPLLCNIASLMHRFYIQIRTTPIKMHVNKLLDLQN